MKQIFFKYGFDSIPVSVPDACDFFFPGSISRQIDPESFYTLAKRDLADQHFSFEKTAVVVADKTRLCQYTQYLPALIKALEDSGAKREQITLFIAYGTHARQTDEESLRAYGDIFRRLSVVHHNCNDADVFKNLGYTSRNTPVLVRKDLLESSCIITFGAISHHYFAGFGGGRKLLFPGLGYRDSIYHNHSLFLDPATGSLCTQCATGNMLDNPLAEDLREFESFLPAHVHFYGILDDRGELCNIASGTDYESFLRASHIHSTNTEGKVNQQYDLVIASCGGYPKDINFIQSHKAIHNASRIVRDRGTLVVFAECRDGIGSATFLPWFRMPSRSAVFNALTHAYEGNGGTALSMMEKMATMSIALVTRLSSQNCAEIGIEQFDLHELNRCIAKAGSIAAIENASVTVFKKNHEKAGIN